MIPQQGEEKIDELVNAFFKEWLPDSFAHLVDNDENDGESLRRELYDLLAQTRQETAREVIDTLWSMRNENPTLILAISIMVNKLREEYNIKYE